MLCGLPAFRPPWIRPCPVSPTVRPAPLAVVSVQCCVSSLFPLEQRAYQCVDSGQPRSRLSAFFRMDALRAAWLPVAPSTASRRAGLGRAKPPECNLGRRRPGNVLFGSALEELDESGLLQEGFERKRGDATFFCHVIACFLGFCLLKTIP